MMTPERITRLDKSQQLANSIRLRQREKAMAQTRSLMSREMDEEIYYRGMDKYFYEELERERLEE